MPGPITILHLSDMQFGKNHLFGRLKVPFPDGQFDSLLVRLIDDLKILQKDEGLSPDLIVVSGDLAEWGLRSEFDKALCLLEGLVDHFGLTRDRVVMVPGNHDVNREACDSYFRKCASDEVEPVEPFRPKWEHFAERFAEFYEPLQADQRPGFPLEDPWTLYKFDDQRIVVAAFNSTMAEIHDLAPTDEHGNPKRDHEAYIKSGKFGHFGYVGERQYRWFTGQLEPFESGWLRLGVVHHNLRRKAVEDDENLRDVDALDEWMSKHVDLWLHGHTHDGKKDYMSSGTLILSTGSTGLDSKARPEEVPCQYQYLRVESGFVRQWTRQYDLKKQKWIPDYRCTDDRKDWRISHKVDFGTRPTTPAAGPTRMPKPADPTRYLQRLRDQTATIDIRGLEVGSGKANKLPIDELYIPLAATSSADRAPEGMKKGGELDEMHRVDAGAKDLRDALRHRTLVVVGDPGSGKSTFLRRVAFQLCRWRLEESSDSVQGPWEKVADCFPILISLAGLAKHLATCPARGHGPTQEDAASWLAHYGATDCEENAVSLDEAFFKQKLQAPDTLVLLDGLDEPPSEKERVIVRKLLEKAAGAFPCRFVVTTRPAAYRGEVLLSGFEEARIAPLDDEALRSFLGAWCGRLWRDNTRDAERHMDELLLALRQRPEIRRLARNPVMLTALAVVHWNDKRLPEQRADLYESIIKWLSKARQFRPERQTPEKCVTLLQDLALAMQFDGQDRQTQWTRRHGATAIAENFRDVDERFRVAAAEQFLKEEEMDSGIIVGRGEHDLRFWHLTFQEYLAARALDARKPEEQARLLLKTDKLHRPEWREVALLLAGVLHRRGIQLVDGLFQTVLDQVGKKAGLADKARSAVLLSAMLNDLAPDRYRPQDPRYDTIMEEVSAVFKAERSSSIPIEEAIAAAEAIGQAGDPRFANPDSPALWATIPAGEFLMGAQKKDKKKPNYDEEAYDDEADKKGNLRKVRLSAFRIGRYPVTVGEYRRFVEQAGYAEPAHWKAGGFAQWEEPDRWDDQSAHPNWPVTGVSWFEAAAYAAFVHARLPTEAEWERAARGDKGRKFPWESGKPDPRQLNGAEGKVGHPTPVGVYPCGATPDGILDLAGNVWEWCWDWFGPYASKDEENPTGPSVSQSRVLRGGSWDDHPRYCRSAYRNWIAPAYRSSLVGVRVASGTV